jgi:hypothetical protein
VHGPAQALQGAPRRDGAGFEVAQGETYGLLGPNGAGKNLRQRLRDRSALVIAFVAPFVLASIIGLAPAAATAPSGPPTPWPTPTWPPGACAAP